jgi:hypothetical protein
LPNNDAKPFIGELGKSQQVEEDRVELQCNEDKIDKVLLALKSAHPYEEVAYDIYLLEDL